ncbi:MAG: protein kinase [Paracoccus sp. (in: a-proteobacteria)]|nr:protein kinase [Paracoccus sp. (in: a-proteobacteria)]
MPEREAPKPDDPPPESAPATPGQPDPRAPAEPEAEPADALPQPDPDPQPVIDGYAPPPRDRTFITPRPDTPEHQPPAPSSQKPTGPMGGGSSAPGDALPQPDPDPQPVIDGYAPPPRDRTLIAARSASDDAPGLGPVFEPSPDPTMIAPAGGRHPPAAAPLPEARSTPPGPATVIGAAPAAARGPATPAKLVEPGTLINNNYRIEALISAGGMGEVYRAVNVYTGDPVAVKVVLPDLARDTDIIDLFRREARVLVQLRDDAIVSYHNFVLDQGLNRYCLIMEFVQGTHLGAQLHRGDPMAPEPALALMRRLAKGLGQAHARGVTHRDLSPDNVILRHENVEEAVLIDFGIARSTELGDGLAGRFAGKFKYIAPEQLGHYEGVIGPQTDVYGLALLIAAMLRNKPLDMGDSVVTASDARRGIPDLSGFSHRIFPLLQFMLEPDPANRPASMAQVVAMLDDPTRIPARYRLPLWNADSPGKAQEITATGISETPFGLPQETAPETTPAPLPGPGRRWPLILGASLLLLLPAAGAVWHFTREAPAPAEPEIPLPDPEPEPVASFPPRDPASRDGFLAELPLGPCAMARRVTFGPGAGTVSLLSADPVAPASVQDAYGAQFGSRPAITQGLVTQAQCPAIDFAAMLAGREALPPRLSAQARATASGFQAEAQVSGPEGRNLWLALIAPDGAVYDLGAQSSATPDGGVRAGVSVDLPGGGAGAASAPYLLLALTSSAPLVSLAAAPAGAPSASLLPAVLDEMASNGPEAAAASLTRLEPAPPPVPEDPDAPPPP